MCNYLTVFVPYLYYPHVWGLHIIPFVHRLLAFYGLCLHNPVPFQCTQIFVPRLHMPAS